MRVTFLTPAAGLVAVAVILPLVAFVRTERRVERVRSLLRLAAPTGSPKVTVAALLAVAVLVGLAAAQPVIEDWHDRPERVDAQVFFVFDTSRSMQASAQAGAPTRWDRAAAAARQMREGLGDVPVGIASMTDRVLPHLFPTSNERSFEDVLRYSIGVDKPASDLADNTNATDFGATRFFAVGNYFRGSRRRVLVVFSDAESKRYDIERLTGAFSDSGIRTILVRIGSPSEKVFGPDGVEQGYVPGDGAAAAEVYARAVRAKVFTENELPAAIDAARAGLGSGTSITRVKTVDIQPLGPFVLAVALVPLIFLLLRRNLGVA
jgi:hypothetical protein